MRELPKRVLAALILAGVFGGLMLWSPLSRWFATSLVFSIGSWEFSRLACIHYGIQRRFALIAPALVGFSLIHFHPSSLHWFFRTASFYPWSLLATGMLAYTLLAFSKLPGETAAPFILFNMAGLALFQLWGPAVFKTYTNVPGFNGILSFFLILLCMVCADTGAYFTGKIFGKNKMCPRLSPKKTWEGFAGGVGATLLIVSFLGPWLTPMNAWQSLGFGLLMSLCAVLGDLFFSSYKRAMRVKDFSTLIPGHGGVLDRFDSLIFSIPFAVLYYSVV